ncbi:MAG: 50S ribosomal protein L24 [Nitrospinota bacterium]
MKIRRDDMVKVIYGASKGKTGRVLESMPKEGMIIVEKVNVVKRHQRPTQDNRQGGIIEKEAKIDVSKVMLICPQCDKPTRVQYKRLEDSSKVRICAKCSEVVKVG